MGASRSKNLAGQRFGFLTVLRREGRSKRREALWRCRCVCGHERLLATGVLLFGGTKSCARGHYNRPMIRVVAGEEYRLWYGMHTRCYNRRASSYSLYGKRGIRVDARWHHFENFLSDMGPRPSVKHSLDRYPDMDGPYAPGNCRWATAKEQGRNTKRAIRIQIGEQEIPLIDFAEQLGLTGPMVRKRLARGWSLNEALSIPAKTHRARYSGDLLIKLAVDKT